MKKFQFTHTEAHCLKAKQYIIDNSGFCVQILNITTSKTGKHGHMKCSIECRRIDSGEKVNLMVPGHTKILSTQVEKERFQLVDWSLDKDYTASITVIDDNGEEQGFNVDLSGENFIYFQDNHHSLRYTDLNIFLVFYPFISKMNTDLDEDKIEYRYYTERIEKA